MEPLDDIFADLIREGTRAIADKKTQKRQVKAAGKKKDNQTALALIDAAVKRKRQIQADLREGRVPDGWAVEGLVAHQLTTHCNCGETQSALSPPIVYLVQFLRRNPATKHLRPLRKGEIVHLLQSGANITLEHSEENIEVCSQCILDAKEHFAGHQSPEFNTDEDNHIPGWEIPLIGEMFPKVRMQKDN